jgi:hypothetical protein
MSKFFRRETSIFPEHLFHWRRLFKNPHMTVVDFEDTAVDMVG